MIIKDLEEFKESEPREYEKLHLQNIHSLVTVPLIENDAVSGIFWGGQSSRSGFGEYDGNPEYPGLFFPDAYFQEPYGRQAAAAQFYGRADRGNEQKCLYMGYYPADSG